MVNAKYFYSFYLVSAEIYDWSIRESEDDEFYTHVVNGTHVECCFEYGALVEERHIETLIKLLEQTEDTREYASIIQTFSEFI